MAIGAQSGLTLAADITANDSDKTITVPAGAQWHLMSLYVQLVTTATVGNRQVDVLITDASDNPIYRYKAGAVQAASLTREYIFAPQHPQETAFTGTTMLRAFADHLVLLAGWKLRIYDSAAIDAAADDLTVRYLVQGRLA